MTALQADLHVSSRPALALPPHEGRDWRWSGLANTLIHNDDFALLVDTSITIVQNRELVTWIKSILGAQPLTHIFITHAHGDHYLGIPIIRDAFPNVTIIAVPDVLAAKKIHDQQLLFLFPALFPDDQLDLRLDSYTVSPLSDTGKFTLSNTTFRAHTVAHGDCPTASFLHCPALDLVCAGDIVIATHLYFAEASTPDKRKDWLAALDAIEALKPQVVIPGHLREGQVPGARAMIEDTRRYIKAWEEAVEASKSAEELWKNMKTKYPTRFGDFVLQAGVDVAFPKKGGDV